jgi:hypothetical protein
VLLQFFDLALLRKMAKPLGWNRHLSAGWAGVCRRADAVNQAVALQPDGSVLDTIDADEQAAVMGAGAAKAMVVVDCPFPSSPTSIFPGRKDLDSGYPEA